MTQLQRLRELGADEASTALRFPDASARDLAFKELERDLTTEGRRALVRLRARGAPQLTLLADRLRATLVDEIGFVEVTTPHIITADALGRMGIPADDPLAEQVFWLDRSHCLRPMLGPTFTPAPTSSQEMAAALRDLRVGTCFQRRRDEQHLTSSRCSTSSARRRARTRPARLVDLARLVMDAAEIDDYLFQEVESGVYGDTLDLVARGVEVCSAAMGPHPLDDAWGITDTWVGLGFGLERLLYARAHHSNIERVGRSLSYLDGVRLHL